MNISFRILASFHVDPQLWMDYRNANYSFNNPGYFNESEYRHTPHSSWNMYGRRTYKGGTYSDYKVMLVRKFGFSDDEIRDLGLIEKNWDVIDARRDDRV